MSQLEYNSSIKSLLLHYQSIYFDNQNMSDKKPSILFNFVISDLLLQNKREKIVELRKFNIDAKVCKMFPFHFYYSGYSFFCS